MELDLQKFLTAVKGRTDRISKKGLRLASDYLSGVRSCLGNDACSCKLPDMDGADWTKALAEAEQKLVFVDDSPLIFKSSDFAILEKTPGAVADFAATLTTSTKDRDRDVLESAGAELDVKMPLLWMHMPFQPMGKMVAKLHQDTKSVKVHYAIADTPLGNDGAVLAEFGALRMSHGFVPKKFEPLPGDDGYHVKEFYIYEGSLVSIPANPEAEILALSRGKLFHPIVKLHAQKLWDAAPKSVVSGFVPTPPLPAQAPATPAALPEAPPAGPPAATGAPEKKTMMVLDGKEYTDAAEFLKDVTAASAAKGVYLGFDGSWEETIEDLDEKAKAHLNANGVLLGYDDYACVKATYPNTAIVCVYRGYPNYGKEFYRIPWKMVKDEPVWDGAPVKVELTLQIEEVEKQLRKQFLGGATAEQLTGALVVKALNGALTKEAADGIAAQITKAAAPKKVCPLDEVLSSLVNTAG